ncbi:MAG: TonB-dependent receptor [Bryobacteraceae bacterium]|nr:TonB-dependent receptor [Bryobacteraceae bacterium]
MSGPYRLTVEHPNFKALVRDGLMLSSDQTLRVEARLEVGSVSEKVEVVGESSMIETDSAQINHVRSWDNRKFLPTRGLDFFSTVALEPGTTTGDPSFEVAFAGSRPNQYTYSINGATFRARPSADGTLSATFNEWQQEIKTSYVNNSAEYQVLANVNATSKSGGNDFHGGGVWYYTSGGLQGRSPFTPARPSGVNHVVATSLGGPIRKNRSFFFIAYSTERDSSATSRNNTVPTARMRDGDFGEISTPIIDPLSGAPFPNNRIPTERIYAGSRNYLQRYYPLPNFGTGFQSQNYRAIFPQRIISDNVFGRADWRITDRHSLFGSYSFTYGNRGNWYSGTNPFPEQIGPRLGFRKPHAVVLSDTLVFTPNLYNELNLSWTREHNNIIGSIDAPEAISTLGVQGVRSVGIPGLPVLSIAGFTNAAQQSRQRIAEDSYTIRDNVSWILGRHRLKFGGVASQSRLSQIPFNVDAFLGSYTFNNNFATRYALADFLLGYPQSVSRQNADFFDTVYRRGNMFQVFVQDDLQLTSRLTINAGVRYQYHQPFLDKNGRAYGFDLQTRNLVVPNDKSLRLLSPQIAAAFPVQTAEQAGFPERLVGADGNNFAPRFGFAYRATSRTVIRGGYGIFYDFNLPVQGNLAPFIPNETYPPNRLINGVPEFRFPNPFPASPNAAGALTLGVANPSLELPYTQQWSFTLEQQVTDNTSARLSYTGTRTIKTIYGRQFNVPEPGTTPFSQSRRPYPQFGGISIDINGQGHNYQGLQAQIEHRTRAGLYMRSHYTLAKDLGESGNQNPFDRRADIGETSYIRRHQFITEFNWDLPFGTGKRFGSNLSLPVRTIFGGWIATGILQIASGRYLTPTYSGFDSSGTGILNGRPDRIADGNLPSDQRTQARWFDPAAFAIPGASAANPLTPPAGPIGRFGNAGVGILIGPGRWQYDMGLVKSVPLWRESARLHLFTLATNLFNHPNLGDPNLDITAPGLVGQITGIHTDGNASGVGMRQLRLGIRFEF